VKVDTVRVGIQEYRRATIQGEMTATNQRQQASKIIVRRALKGKVLSTEGESKVRPQEGGMRAVNPSHEIVFNSEGTVSKKRRDRGASLGNASDRKYNHRQEPSWRHFGS
jgi:hypothetical protein